MEYRVQSINISLMTIEPVNTWDFKAQVCPMVEAVPQMPMLPSLVRKISQLTTLGT